MNNILGTWYFPHILLQDDIRVEYLKFKENDEYIYNDGLGRSESTFTHKEPNLIILKLPSSSKEVTYEYELGNLGTAETLKLVSKEKGISFTLLKATS
jgi:hypothetical protein